MVEVDPSLQELPGHVDVSPVAAGDYQRRIALWSQRVWVGTFVECARQRWLKKVVAITETYMKSSVVDTSEVLQEQSNEIRSQLGRGPVRSQQ